MLHPIRTKRRMSERQCFDALHGFQGMGFRDGREVFQTLEALGFEPVLPFIEAGPTHPAAAGFGCIAEFCRELQDA